MSRYLVIQLARFGDLVQTKRLALSLATEPGAELHLCLDRSLADLARIIYPTAEIHSIEAHAAPGRQTAADLFARNYSVFTRLGRMDFDLVFNLNYSGMNFALAGLFPPDRVRGHIRRKGQPVKDPLVSLGFRWTARRNISPLNLVDFWGWLADNPLAPDKVNPPAAPGGGGLGVVLGGRDQRRSPPPKVLALAAQALLSNLGGAKKVFLLGSKADLPLARAFKRRAGPRLLDSLVDLCGRTGWAELAERTSSLDLLLTPDTGTMHLAAHLGTPVQAMFLSSAWAFETGPYGLGHRVWQAAPDCAPCLEARPCPHEVRCLPPFSSREFLRILSTGKISEPFPTDMIGLSSRIDPLGSTFARDFGLDPWEQERSALRRLLAERLGLPLAPEESDPPMADLLYQEKDWMLDFPAHNSPRQEFV